jgi:outer membrane protein TolC
MIQIKRPALVPPLSALLIGAVCAPARADVVPLAELERRALEARPELREREADARAQAAEFDRARAAFMPQFALRADTSIVPGSRVVPIQQYDGTLNPDGTLTRVGQPVYVNGAPAITQGSSAFTPRFRAGLELNGSASLYDFGRRAAAGDAARLAGKASEAQRTATREELLAVVRVRYLGWLAADELGRLASQSLADARARRERIEQLVNEGTRPKAELAAARATELTVSLDAERAAADLEGARHALAEAAASELKEGDSPDLTWLDAPSADQGAANTRALEALERAGDAKRAAAVAEERATRPDLRVGASLGVRTQQAVDTDGKNGWATFPLYAASVSLSVPLWDGGSSAAGAAKARAEAEAVLAQRDRLKLAQLRDAAQAGAEAAHAERRAAAAGELVALSKARVDDAEAGFQLGAVSQDQVAEARAALRRAETEALLARIDLAAAKLRGAGER